MVTNQRKHLDVVRKMYMMRFPDEDVSGLTLQQLRGREGSRIRKVYRQQSEKWNVEWNGRVYNHEDFQSSDPVNQALSAAHACLYGLAHAVICSMGCSPALGFVHIGHECSFVYDIADLYKAEVTIPISFEAAASVNDDISRFVRHRVRDEMVKAHMLERMVHDIKYLLMPEEKIRMTKKPCICGMIKTNLSITVNNTGDDMMVVITLSCCPPKLRGDLSRWMQEIDTGVYVGNLNARVRDNVWDRVCSNIGNGHASMSYSSNNEQKLEFRIHNTQWEPVDYDGIKLIKKDV